MTIQQLIADLDAKREKATKGEWANLRPGGHPPGIVCDIEGESWDVTDDADYIVALHNTYDQLKRAALAGAKLAEEVEKMDNPTIAKLTMSNVEKEMLNLLWRAQRDAALKAYKDAMGE